MLAIGAIDVGAGARRCLSGHEFQTRLQDKGGRVRAGADFQAKRLKRWVKENLRGPLTQARCDTLENCCRPLASGGAVAYLSIFRLGATSKLPLNVRGSG